MNKFQTVLFVVLFCLIFNFFFWFWKDSSELRIPKIDVIQKNFSQYLELERSDNCFCKEFCEDLNESKDGIKYLGVPDEHCKIIEKLFFQPKIKTLKEESFEKIKVRGIKERRAIIASAIFLRFRKSKGMMKEMKVMYESWKMITSEPFIILDLILFTNKPLELEDHLPSCTRDYRLLDPFQSNCYLIEYKEEQEKKIFENYPFLYSIEFPVQFQFLESYSWLFRTDLDVVFAPMFSIFWPNRFTVFFLKTLAFK